MQISSGQDGIQRLLKAEQEAQAIVSKARKGIVLGACLRLRRSPLYASTIAELRANHLFHAAKSDRLKQANQEAERDIKAFRSQQEEKYQKKISTVRAWLPFDAACL